MYDINSWLLLSTHTFINRFMNWHIFSSLFNCTQYTYLRFPSSNPITNAECDFFYSFFLWFSNKIWFPARPEYWRRISQGEIVNSVEWDSFHSRTTQAFVFVSLVCFGTLLAKHSQDLLRVLHLGVKRPEWFSELLCTNMQITTSKKMTHPTNMSSLGFFLLLKNAHGLSVKLHHFRFVLVACLMTLFAWNPIN